MSLKQFYLYLYLKRKAADYYGKSVEDCDKDEGSVQDEDAGHDGKAGHGEDAAESYDEIDMSSLIEITEELID